MNHAHRNFRRVAQVPKVRQRHRNFQRVVPGPKKGFGKKAAGAWGVRRHMIMEVETPRYFLRKNPIPEERPLYGIVVRTAKRKRPQIAIAGCLLLAGVLTAAVAGFAYVCYKKIEARDRALEQKIEATFGRMNSRLGKMEAKVEGDVSRLVEALREEEGKLRKLEKVVYGEDWKPPIIRCEDGEECK